MKDSQKAISVLTMNTLAFTICFACWMMYGVLVTFLVDNDIFQWSQSQVGWLIGIPVLTGSILRLPVGMLTDKFGGRKVFVILLLFSAVAMYLVSYANSFLDFLLGGLGFGVAGAGFAVGIAYTSVWFPKERQGTALGIFGMGNAGAAITSMGAPALLTQLTNHLEHVEAWRLLPQIYAIALVIMTIIFYLFTYPKKVEQQKKLTLLEQLNPLKDIRVWRFGFYYFLVFGAFVALSQWLIPYYVNVYTMSLATAGLMTSIFSLPSGLIRSIGGWISDKWGARKAMYIVLWTCLACSFLLIFPRVDIQSPGKGVMATRPGIVKQINSAEIEVGKQKYPLIVQTAANQQFNLTAIEKDILFLPTFSFWQEPVVKIGQTVKKKELLAHGITHVYFQANVWVFTGLVLLLGIFMGIGKAAVYRHIPDYFPNEVGVVGGLVGVIGGLGGFFCPIIFGYLLQLTGIWTTCWMFLSILSFLSLWWMHRVITKMMQQQAPQLMSKIDHEMSV